MERQSSFLLIVAIVAGGGWAIYNTPLDAIPDRAYDGRDLVLPDDPSAGKPFEYVCNENSALLTGSTSVLPSSHNTSYRIAIRH